MAHPMSEPWVNWQLIGDFHSGGAPWDGRSVLVAEDGVVSEAYYDFESDAWWLANTSEYDFDPSRPIYPTHWTPMPSPPTP